MSGCLVSSGKLHFHAASSPCQGAWLVLASCTFMQLLLHVRVLGYFWQAALSWSFFSMWGCLVTSGKLHFHAASSPCQGDWLLLCKLNFHAASFPCQCAWLLLESCTFMQLLLHVRCLVTFGKLHFLLASSPCRMLGWVWQAALSCSFFYKSGCLVSSGKLHFHAASSPCLGAWLVLASCTFMQLLLHVRVHGYFWQAALSCSFFSMWGCLVTSGKLLFHAASSPCQGAWLLLASCSFMQLLLHVRVLGKFWQTTLSCSLFSMLGSLVRSGKLNFHAASSPCQEAWLGLASCTFMQLLLQVSVLGYFWQAALSCSFFSMSGCLVGSGKLLFHAASSPCQGVWLLLASCTFMLLPLHVRKLGWVWHATHSCSFFSISGCLVNSGKLHFHAASSPCQDAWLGLARYTFMQLLLHVRMLGYFWQAALSCTVFSMSGCLVTSDKLHFHAASSPCQGVWLLLASCTFMLLPLHVRKLGWVWYATQSCSFFSISGCLVTSGKLHFHAASSQCQDAWLLLTSCTFMQLLLHVRFLGWVWQAELSCSFFSMSGCLVGSGKLHFHAASSPSQCAWLLLASCTFMQLLLHVRKLGWVWQAALSCSFFSMSECLVTSGKLHFHAASSPCQDAWLGLARYTFMQLLLHIRFG